MIKKISSVIEGTIWLSYLSLAILTPLIFTTNNSELFEVPKMHFVYFFATVLLFATIAKVILTKEIRFPSLKQGPTLLQSRSDLVAFLPLTFLGLFLVFQLLSTINSLDRFTSVFGYPSRLNGGLLSQFAYFAIFATALINLDAQSAKKILIGLVIGAAAVSVWGIPSHFNLDPTCFVLTQKLTSACWQKDFDPMIRIFSTLGQPNWLASYLVLILPVAIILSQAASKTGQKILFSSASFLIFTALVMTNSRAGILGAAVAIVILIAINFKTAIKNKFLWGSLLISFTLATLIFGGFLFQRFFEAKQSIQQNSLEQAAQTAAPTQPQGTESGQIRLIVWKGAIDAFLARPLLGWGPETFAYSYYKFRPLAHNATTEWNFFYNKAHNEFLSYLANIGLLGTTFYLVFLASVIYLILKFQKNENYPVSSAAVASIIGYHVTIFFGFSTVATQTSMFLLIASSLVLTGKNTVKVSKLNLGPSQIPLLFAAGLLFLLLISYVIRLYFADLFFASSNGSALKNYQNAIEAFPAKNPFYLSEYAYSLATLAQDATGEKNKVYAQEALSKAKEAERVSPANLIIERRVANTYILLLKIQKAKVDDAAKVAEKIKSLAPTDPASYITSAKIHLSAQNLPGAKKDVEKALELKPGLVESLELLDQINAKIVETQ